MTPLYPVGRGACSRRNKKFQKLSQKFLGRGETIDKSYTFAKSESVDKKMRFDELRSDSGGEGSSIAI